jgi:uncharacterized membrane protein
MAPGLVHRAKIAPPLSRHDWLLLIHVGGAFCVLAGALFAVVLNQAALRRSKPSEVALLLGLIRISVVLIVLGMAVTLAFGLWLLHDTRYDLGDAWIGAALALWLAALVAGGFGGRRDRKTRELAERLATEGDRPTEQLQGRLRDPISMILSYGSGAAIIAILVLMIGKPGT